MLQQKLGQNEMQYYPDPQKTLDQQYTRGDNQWPGDIAAWRDAGGSHISVVTMGANLTTVDSHIEAIRRWRDVYNSVR